MKNEESKQEKQQLPEEHQQIEKESQKQNQVDSQDDTLSVASQQSSYVDYEEILRQQEFVPIRPLGRGAFGIVYEAYDLENGIVAVKIIQKEKFDIRELEAAEIINNEVYDCPFIMEHKLKKPNKSYQFLIEEYSNMNTLNLFAKQPQITLPSYVLRTLMKQILEGMRVFHRTGLVHRDIKCDNILLQCQPGTGIVYAKISDFGFAKKEDSKHEQTYFAGTLPYMSPENFHQKAIITQKVDIYALGITFYNIIVHKYPVNQPTFQLQQKMMAQIQSIERPSEIKDDILWDLLSQMLEFDPIKRISAEQALEHPFFTSPESQIDISSEQENKR
ncbi:MAG: putative Serine/threonine-protein kinase ATG1a [Streblomastix strix]|nr:MAG: putative Serine/threonine-protein kinase ATG1a [Streblomastix strix]